MSHELRTPLSFIIGFSDIMLQGISGEINQEQRKQLTLVKNHANHLLSLINDAININKIDAGKVEMAIEEFDLPALSREIKDSFFLTTDKKGQKLSLEIPQTLLIESDRMRVQQVLVNLLSNAIKFTARGEIKIKVIQKDEIVEVSVRDSGIGIKKENMNKLFKSFSQIPNPGRIEEGTGLGLYLSKKNANLLGGDIIAKSEWGKGSVFTLTLSLKYKEGRV
jgi:signal transduction histidine kinase